MLPHEMLLRVNSAQLTELMAYSKIDPWDELRDDLRAGIIASTMFNAYRGKKQRAKSAADFMPYAKPPKKKMTWEQMRAAAMAFTAKLGGTLPGKSK